MGRKASLAVGAAAVLKGPSVAKEQKPTPENCNGKQAEKSYCHSKNLRRLERLVVPQKKSPAEAGLKSASNSAAGVNTAANA